MNIQTALAFRFLFSPKSVSLGETQTLLVVWKAAFEPVHTGHYEMTSLWKVFLHTNSLDDSINKPVFNMQLLDSVECP